MFVSHFVDPDLRMEIFFKKEGTLKNGGINFEVGDIGTSAHLYWQGFIQALQTVSILWKKIEFYKGEKDREAIIIAAGVWGSAASLPNEAGFSIIWAYHSARCFWAS